MNKLQYLEDFYWFSYHNDMSHIKLDINKLIIYDAIINSSKDFEKIKGHQTINDAINSLFPDGWKNDNN